MSKILETLLSIDGSRKNKLVLKGERRAFSPSKKKKKMSTIENEWTRRKITNNNKDRRILFKRGNLWDPVSRDERSRRREELSHPYIGGDERSKRNLYFNRSIEKPLSVQRQTRIYFAVYIPPIWRISGQKKRGEVGEGRRKEQNRRSYIRWWNVCGGQRRKHTQWTGLTIPYRFKYGEWSSVKYTGVVARDVHQCLWLACDWLGKSCEDVER